MVSRDSNFPIFTARNGQIKVWPIFMEHPRFQLADITVAGCAPVIFHDEAAGITQYCYQPSAQHSINVLGESPVTVTLGGVTQYCYPATGGITMGGSIDVDVAADLRGGKAKGRRRPQPQRTIHYYHAEAFFENTLVLGGEADVMFIPARYQFIKSLPKLPEPDLYTDSAFKELYKELERRQPTTTFTYVAEPGGLKIGGAADEDYFDFKNFIIIHDEDIIIADILSTDNNPFITTTFSQNLAKQRRDDDDILNILELL